MEKFSLEDIIRFADGEMEEQERLVFEEELAVNLNLKKDLDLYNDVQSTLKMKYHKSSLEDLALEAKLSKLKLEYFTDKRLPITAKKINPFFKYMSVAAVLIIALMIWAPWSNKLYNKYSPIEMISVVERGNEIDKENVLNSTREKFNRKQFEAAKQGFEILLKSDPENDMLKFYYAVTLLETNSIDNARLVFNEVFSGESIFKNTAAFYYALTYVKEKNNEQAIIWLQKVDKESSVYAKAQELKNQL